MEYTYLDEETNFDDEAEGLVIQTIELFQTLLLKNQLKNILK